MRNVSVYECAAISGNVYWLTAHDKKQPVGITILHSTESTITTPYWLRVKDFVKGINPGQNFYAALYIYFNQNKAMAAVIAFRGTLHAADYFVDIKAWSSDTLGDGDSAKLPSYYPMAMHFVHAARDYLREHHPHLIHIYLTGHSLGGGLAKLITLAGHLPYPAVSFNGPGVGHIPGVTYKHAGRVCNINARYGVINKVGLTIGKIFWIYIPEEAQEAKALFQNFDKTDYQESKQEYKNADKSSSEIEKLSGDAGAVWSRILSYRASGDTITSLTETEKAFHDCYNKEQADRWHHIYSSAIEKKICAGETTVTEYYKVIYAQHTIDNILSTLRSSDKHLASMVV